jgi:Tc toxin complex TcA C-terminal TcB-binding domain
VPADAADDLAALREVVALSAGLGVQYGLRGSAQGLLSAYQNDPFDPHAIAALRTAAYRRTTVMSYVDNLIDWADMLFRQYTPEGIDEARMLYVLAADLLGPRPDAAGPRPLPADLSYARLSAAPSPQDGPVTSDELAELTAGGALLTGAGAMHRHVVDDYFFVPANSTLTGYWDLIADRLGKIRHSLDILGVSRPVPLFAPPLDPMQLVRSVASGASVATAVQAAAGPVPHYRFAVLLGRAQDLTDRVRLFGQDLLSALAQRDAEQLSLLQNRQEGDILAITLAERQAQLGMAKAGLDSVTASHAAAVRRHDYYQGLLDNGLSAEQALQVGLLAGATVLQSISSGLRVGAALATGAPQVLVGPFIMGVMEGGQEIGGALNEGAGVMDSAAQALSTGAEIAGIAAEQRQSRQEWQFQVDLAGHDIDQITGEIAVAQGAVVVAQRELDLLNLQIGQQAEVAAFLRGKFSSAELYQWTADQLGGVYFQAYGLAVDTARSAERAYRFERGVPEGDVAFVQSAYWDDRRHGMLAGDQLAVDLTRMAAAYQDGHSRGMEITRRISLRELDPLALLRLRATGGCEFSLTEDLFDRDFPGHYRRQVRTVSVSFTDAVGAVLPVAAVLTQTTHRTVLAADQKAVRYLLDPTGTAPDTVRVDWRADQQIALSDVPDGYENNGLFELNYSDDRYLPFEGTGAVSSWQLDLTGRRPADGLPADVVVTLRYTAETGGDVFTTAVRGMLRPRTTARYLDAATDFPDAWQAFTSGSTPSLVLPITPADLPGLSGRQITGIQAVYQPADPSSAGNPCVLVGGDPALALTGGTMLPTPAFALPATGLTLTPAPGTDAGTLADIVLVLTYRATS